MVAQSLPETEPPQRVIMTLIIIQNSVCPWLFERDLESRAFADPFVAIPDQSSRQTPTLGNSRS